MQSVRRRQAALDAQALTGPAPPQAMHFPELTSRAGAALITAEGRGVRDRLAPVSLTVRGRSRLLITGPNGAGKSTLLAILAEELDPDQGAVHHSAHARRAYLQQESALRLEQRASTVYANHVDRLVAAGMVPDKRVVGLASLGLLRSAEMNKRVGELSMGQQRRLDLALALAARPNLLLLDEPTNHLSITLVDELTEAFEATAAAVVLSSHDRQLLRDLGHWPQLELQPASGKEPNI